MGIIDQASFTFTCRNCNTQERATALEYGSSYGASWGSPSELTLFAVEWKSDDFGGPTPATAVCVKCKRPAEVARS